MNSFLKLNAKIIGNFCKDLIPQGIKLSIKFETRMSQTFWN